jgi:putative membrane protein
MAPDNQSIAVKPDTATQLAVERTFLAYERTLMAWVRTALSLITFGFTISRFYEYLNEKQSDRGTLLSPAAVGILMILIGLLSLAMAGWQHHKSLTRLRAEAPDLPASITSVMAALIAGLGILALLASLIR